MLRDTNEKEVLRWQLFGKQPGGATETSVTQLENGHGLHTLKNKTNKKKKSLQIFPQVISIEKRERGVD